MPLMNQDEIASMTGVNPEDLSKSIKEKYPKKEHQEFENIKKYKRWYKKLLIIGLLGLIDLFSIQIIYGDLQSGAGLISYPIVWILMMIFSENVVSIIVGILKMILNFSIVYLIICYFLKKKINQLSMKI